MEFQVRYLALFLLFWVIDDFEWFWMESLHKNIQLMLEFLKGPFLILLFLIYINDFPDDFIINIAVLLVMILSTLNVIRHVICGNR